MKNKIFILIITILVLVATGCADDSGDEGVGGGGIWKLGQTRKFWAYNYETGKFYQLDAQLLAENTRCEVWVEQPSSVGSDVAQSIANTYSGDIYYKMMSTFGFSLTYRGKTYSNVMDFAHYIATGESYGKLTILLLDIKDSYEKNGYKGYIAGYFNPVDFYDQATANSMRNSPKTNRCDMIYIDTYPGLIDINTRLVDINRIKDANNTLAHELQHLMNFISTVAFSREFLMHTWIDEGLSSAAEWVYGGEHPQDKLNNYNSALGLIAEGNNFFVWGNREAEDKYAVLADYATVYLFFQWLRLQANSTIIYKDIITSSKYDQDAVTEALNKKVGGYRYSSWNKVLEGWLAANYIQSSTGAYGYGSDPADSVLNRLEKHYAPTGSQNINLYPGEGVYSYVSSLPYTIPTSGQIIKYAGLTSTVVPSGNTISSVGALLTYNADVSGSPVSGTTTGAVPSIGIVKSVSGSGQGSMFTKPFPISMGDELRRSGREIDFYKIDFNLLKKIVNE